MLKYGRGELRYYYVKPRQTLMASGYKNGCGCCFKMLADRHQVVEDVRTRYTVYAWKEERGVFIQDDEIS